jgi:uncharacterized protein YjbI with pentapeptide repeats
MDASELLARYAAGERDFCGIALSGADLSGADLCGADLCGANLSEANLTTANLTTADLTGAILCGANLCGAILCEANLTTADLTEAILCDAYLYRAILCDAYLNGAILIYAYLEGANLNGANLNGANLSDANLNGANLFEVGLTNANLSGANIDGTILAYQKVSEELQRENQQLIERIKILKFQLIQQKLIQQKSKQDLTKASNQGINAPNEWKGFYFRSKAEIKIAEALDRAGVLFYPNSKARLNQSEVRVNKESDFLVFQAGKFGILEVDGREWHQIAADDHERDRLFKRYGIRVIERFDATRCWNEPDKVVQEFLEILSHA